MNLQAVFVQHCNELNDALPLLDLQRRVAYARGGTGDRRYNALLLAGVILERERDDLRRRIAKACAPWFEPFS